MQRFAFSIPPMHHEQEMREGVLAIYQGRKNLAATLKDTKSIVGKLERLVGFILHGVFIVFYLLIWNVCMLLCVLRAVTAMD
jgi:hypothetical protein